MILLILSIILTSYLTISFKVLGQIKIPALQAIVINYFTCVITGSLVNGSFPITATSVSQPWFLWAIVMGLVFITLFNIIAFTAQRIGVAVASVANKLSLVIPFLFSIYLYDEKLTTLKIAGVIIALMAVLFTCWPHKDIQGSSIKSAHGLVLLVPVVLFIGSGMLDTMIKYVEQLYLNGTNNDNYFITAFAMAGVSGGLLLLFQIASGRQKFDLRAIPAGILIGIPNYFSLWTLVKVLAANQGNSSAIFPIVNIGIVLLSTLAALILFREKLSKLNWTGVGLAIFAILMMAYAG
jgi:drug/metabolite transporter (DMT)-like permease